MAVTARRRKRRGVVILGSTGSIGRSALSVIRELAPRFRVVGLSTRRRVGRLMAQAEEFRPRWLAVADEHAWNDRPRATAPNLLTGPGALERLAGLPDADIVLLAVVGAAGLAPALAALRAGKRVAIANKEPLVMAGELLVRTAKRAGAEILPVDSEHSALFQCLGGRDASGGVRRLILTASGGPFLRRRRLDGVTVAQALRHPTWRMGPKVTVDSATLMNKGLEVIEAHWLFGVPVEAIRVVIHPQSVVHSMVEYVDGSVLAQLSTPDMRLPIQYALCYPDRMQTHRATLPLTSLPPLTFEEPARAKFPALDLAYAAARTGGTMPAVLNAANEVAVARFLAGRLPFTGIPRVVERAMAAHRATAHPSLEEILEADRWARGLAGAS